MSTKKKSSLETIGSPMDEFSSTIKINPPSGINSEYHEKDDLYNPFEHRDMTHANSDMGALAHLIKSSLGSGILAMPNAIKNGGLVVGGIGTIIIGFICAHCVHILIKSSHVLCRRTKTPVLTFSETARAAFECGPRPLRRFANSMRILVNVAVCATCIGGACVYLLFISKSIKQVVDHHTESDVGLRYYIVSLIPVLVILSQIRKLKYLVPFSMIANISMIGGLAITMYYVFSDVKPVSSVEPFAKIEQMPSFFATVIFAIEGIAVTMPVANNMRNPEHFIGCPSVLTITMTIVVSLYGLVGIFGYLRYGAETSELITLSLHTPDLLAQAAKLLMALSMLFTYALTFYVPLDMICNNLRPKMNRKYQSIGETSIRFVGTLMTAAVAIAVPSLDPIMGLIGSICLSILGICIPAIIETISCWEAHLGRFKWRLFKNVCLFGFAMFALVTGTWVSILAIIQFYTTG